MVSSNGAFEKIFAKIHSWMGSALELTCPISREKHRVSVYCAFTDEFVIKQKFPTSLVLLLARHLMSLNLWHSLLDESGRKVVVLAVKIDS